MFDRFSERARKVTSLARQESLRLNHDYIGTEHLLLGMVEVGGGVAVQALRNLKVEPSEIRSEVKKIVKTGTRMVTFGQLPFTPRGKRVLELALEEAQSLGHNYIGTEHLLLGLIREEDGIAARVLLHLGANFDDVRAQVLEVLGAGSGEGGPFDPPGPPRPVAGDAMKAVMQSARKQAADRRHRIVGTEHLLLGVVLSGGPAAEVILASGTTSDAVRVAVGMLRADGPVAEAPAFSPCATAALNLAMTEAERRGHRVIGPEHLLSGLLTVTEGLAVTALANLGIASGALHARVKELLEVK